MTDEQQHEPNHLAEPLAVHFAKERAALAAKKAQVMSQLDRVPQSGKHSQGWRYASDADYLDAIRPAMAAAGLALTVRTMSHERVEHGQTRNQATRYLTRVRVEICLTCAETGATEDTQWIGEGIDEEDKGIAKAITNAKKDFLKTTFLASSGDEVQAAPAEHHPNAPRPPRAPKAASKDAVVRVVSAMKEAGVSDGTDMLDIAGAITGQEITSMAAVSTSDAGKIAALVSHAAKEAGDGAHFFLMELATNDPDLLKTKASISKAWAAVQSA